MNVDKPWNDTERISWMIARHDAFERTLWEIRCLPETCNCPEVER